MRKIRVLVVDDSVVVRRAVADMLAAEESIELAGWAANGRLALDKLDQISPDVVTLDVEMPMLGGMETLAEMRKRRPGMPVIMLSSHTERGARTTLDALALGASDYVTKPGDGNSLELVRDDLIRKIKVFGGLAIGRPFIDGAQAPAVRREPPVRLAPDRRIDLVAIGVSTGGPNALTEVLSELPAKFPVPIVVVQHMPELFIKLLVQRLASKCAVGVKEAEAGDELKPGQVLVAPGEHHMELAQDGARVVIRINQGPRENSCRPSVDVLFRSVGPVFGAHALAIVMTGIGHDGLRGCEVVREHGGQIWVQDEASSVVWGMPRAVYEAGQIGRAHV
jgi:two-component system chemotaxis response regulator CheB